MAFFKISKAISAARPRDELVVNGNTTTCPIDGTLVKSKDWFGWAQEREATATSLRKNDEDAMSGSIQLENYYRQRLSLLKHQEVPFDREAVKVGYEDVSCSKCLNKIRFFFDLSLDEKTMAPSALPTREQLVRLILDENLLLEVAKSINQPTIDAVKKFATCEDAIRLVEALHQAAKEIQSNVFVKSLNTFRDTDMMIGLSRQADDLENFCRVIENLITMRRKRYLSAVLVAIGITENPAMPA